MAEREAMKDLLRRLRKDRGLTQEALEKATGGKVTASFIGLVETGRRSPSTETIDVLVKAMKLSAAERQLLIEAKGTNPQLKDRVGTLELRVDDLEGTLLSLRDELRAAVEALRREN